MLFLFVKGSSMTVQVLVNGAQGRMGVEAVKAITNDNELSLVGTAGRNDDLGALIEQLKPNVVVDLTNCALVIPTNGHDR